MIDIARRGLVGLVAASGLAGRAEARMRDGATMAWPCDVPSWDPNRRFVPDAQPIYKMLFDQPLEQDSRFERVPHLVTRWRLAEDARSLELELRDDVRFHDGARMTSQDLRWTFHERIAAGDAVDTAWAWRKVAAIETPSATRAVMRFDTPFPTAPAWLAFLGSFVVPQDYMRRVGADGFEARPVGTGPYRLAEHQVGTRIVFERNEAYWGPRPSLRRVVIAVIGDPAARVVAVRSGEADLTIGVPVREAARLGQVPGLEAEVNPISRVVLLQVRGDGVFADRDIRLACHHAIDKAALSRAFCGNAAAVLSLPSAPDGFAFPHDPNLALQLLERSGHGPGRPVRIRMATTSGLFAGDHDIARAIVAMWGQVGIAAALEVIDHARYFELNRGNLLPEATLYAFDNAAADPETCIGCLLDPRLPFSPWKDMALGRRAIALFDEAGQAERLEGWAALARAAVEEGACMPLFQGVQTLVRRASLSYRKYGNGWVLPQTMERV